MGGRAERFLCLNSATPAPALRPKPGALGIGIGTDWRGGVQKRPEHALGRPGREWDKARRVLSWPSKIRAGKGCFFSGWLNFALKKISADRRPVSAMPRVVKRSEPSRSVAVAMKRWASREIKSDCSLWIRAREDVSGQGRHTPIQLIHSLLV